MMLDSTKVLHFVTLQKVLYVENYGHKFISDIQMWKIKNYLTNCQSLSWVKNEEGKFPRLTSFENIFLKYIA